MRLGSVILATVPFCSLSFAPATTKAGTKTSTSLEVRRSLFPTLERPSLMFPNYKSMYKGIDAMLEESLAMTRHPFGLLDLGDISKSILKRPLGFDVSQDDHEYQLTMNVPEAEAKDLDLQLDHDGRVLRLKGDRSHEEGGMTVKFRFEKAILLSPDIDTSKIKAKLSHEGTLTVVAPKFGAEEVLDKVESKKANKKIEIHFEDPKAALESNTDSNTQTCSKPPIQTLEDETRVTNKNTQMTSYEQKWPVRDFPY